MCYCINKLALPLFTDRVRYNMLSCSVLIWELLIVIKLDQQNNIT